MHELCAERGVFGCCDAAEEGEFVLWVKEVEMLARFELPWWEGHDKEFAYLAQDVEAGNVGE